MRANKNGDNEARIFVALFGCGVAKWLVRGVAAAPDRILPCTPSGLQYSQ